jgi:hypothetical protein
VFVNGRQAPCVPSQISLSDPELGRQRLLSSAFDPRFGMPTNDV